MTKSTITRERLEKIKSWRETYGAGSNVMLPAEEAEELARMALAAMDSEPVAVPDHLTYLQNPTLENVLSDAEENSPMAHAARILAREVKFWRSAPLYRHPQPAPVVPGKWISVSERMPEDRTQVILWDAEIGEVTSGHYSHKTQTFYHYGDAIENEITHWMPPPCAPQEVGDV